MKDKFAKYAKRTRYENSGWRELPEDRFPNQRTYIRRGGDPIIWGIIIGFICYVVWKILEAGL